MAMESAEAAVRIRPSEDDDADSSNGDLPEDQVPGAYEPGKYPCPDAPSQVRNLFSFITYYAPQMVEISARLEPFTPDYIPTVGDVDAFLKVPVPRARSDLGLGLTVLDEPSLQQSEPAVLQMKLKALSKESHAGTSAGGSGVGPEPGAVPQVSGGPQLSCARIQQWIESVETVHRTRPDSTASAAVGLVQQHASQETVEALMQEWPEPLESVLNVHPIPTGELDCSLEEYLSLLGAILDIPVQNNRIGAAHLLFTVLNEFQNSQHFSKY